MGKLYVVPVDGGMPRDAGPGLRRRRLLLPRRQEALLSPSTARASPTGGSSTEGRTRTDVTVMDVAAKHSPDLTDFAGLRLPWPMFGHDGFVHFVSDRDGKGLTNLWRVGEKGGNAEKVTQFTAGDVRFPTISGDGKTIVFEHDFGVWKLDVAAKKAAPLRFDIVAETQETLVDWATSTRRWTTTTSPPTARSGSPSPDPRRGSHRPGPMRATSSRSPTAPTATRTSTTRPRRQAARLFVGQGRPRGAVCRPGGRHGPGAEDHEHRRPQGGHEWSPDSKSLLVLTSDGKLMKVDPAGKEPAKELMASKYGSITGAHWSPDGKFVVYSRPGSRSTDVYLLPSDGGEEKKITFDSSDEVILALLGRRPEGLLRAPRGGLQRGPAPAGPRLRHPP